MPETKTNETTYQPMTFDAIKIVWLHLKRLDSGLTAKLKSRKPLITDIKAGKRRSVL